MLRLNRSATSSPSQIRHRLHHSERGSGLLSAVFGVGIVVALVGVLANVAIGLWVRSTVDSVAFDAAQSVATADDSGDSPSALAANEQEAISRARELLGAYGNRVDFEFIDSGSPTVIALRVRAPGTSLMPRMFAESMVIGKMDRTILVRSENR